MEISNLAKKLWKYLPVLAVLVANVLGLFIGKDLYAPLSTERNNPQPLIVLGEEGFCRFSNIYTSLPPKCKTPEGDFIPVPGTSPYLFVTPQGK
jgi:hypothetical protein